MQEETSRLEKVKFLIQSTLVYFYGTYKALFRKSDHSLFLVICETVGACVSTDCLHGFPKVTG